MINVEIYSDREVERTWHNAGGKQAFICTDEVKELYRRIIERIGATPGLKGVNPCMTLPALQVCQDYQD